MSSVNARRRLVSNERLKMVKISSACSGVIFFDNPFEIGDFIIVDEKLGTVEYIGIKTTHVRTLNGDQLIFSNSDLTNSRVHNYKRM